MSEGHKGRYISYLVDRVEESELDKKAMKEELAAMKRKKVERKAEKLQAQLEFAKKNKFGSR